MQALENDVSQYTDKASRAGQGWYSDTIQPISDRPEDKGLYVVTTYDEFFKTDLEMSKNGGESSK